ncbi:MAG: aminotransferase class III-fold pyridoxal phosphate-dependent enzyme [Acidimicrobiia bacterium]
MPAFLHPYAHPAREDFIEIVRGHGAVVEDSTGRSYLDGMGSLWYANVGHGRREIIDAVVDQMSNIAAYHCFEPFTNGPADRLAGRIAGLAPMEDARVFFTSSGSEAVDSAIKLARVAHDLGGQPQRDLIISRSRAYHGVTYGGLSAQGLPANQEGYGPFVDGMINLPADDLEAVAAFMAERGSDVAAVLVEPVQGAGGVYPPPEGYLEGLRRLCDQHGAFLIFDEVICAFGRLGEWFGATHYGVPPDLITFAKAVTSGYIPLGGVVVGPTVRAPLESDATYMLRHGHTYSGHPTACAASWANLDILEREHLLERAPVIAERLGGGFRSLADDGLLAEARGDGGVWAAGLTDQHDANVLRDGLLERGVIARAIGTNTLAYCPPLVTTDEQLDTLVDTLADVLR